nr:MFS transporter [uncultured Bacillus sp.]
MSNFRKWLTLFLLSLGGGTIYIVPYFKFSYYDQLQMATGLSNYQLGMLMTVMGILNFIFYIPGGAIADKLSARSLFTFSMIATGGLTIWYGTMPGYTTLLIIHGLFAATTVLTFWSAFLKGIRACGTKEEQGRMFGISDAIRAIAGTVISFALLAILGRATTDAVGVANSLYVMGILYIVIGILTFFLMPRGNEAQVQDEGEEQQVKFSFGTAMQVLKMPAVWFISINIFCWYVAYTTITYAVPYLTDGFGMTTTMASTVGIIRMYVITILAAPIAGFLADKMKSSSKLLIYCGVLCTVLTALYIIVPSKAALVILMVVITLAVGAIISAARGVYFATMAETKIPLFVTGVATGIISVISYSPDLFIQAMYGKWIDNFGITGYKYIFAFMTGTMIVSIVTAILIRKIALKAEKKSVNKIAG